MVCACVCARTHIHTCLCIYMFRWMAQTQNSRIDTTIDRERTHSVVSEHIL